MGEASGQVPPPSTDTAEGGFNKPLNPLAFSSGVDSTAKPQIAEEALDLSQMLVEVDKCVGVGSRVRPGTQHVCLLTLSG